MNRASSLASLKIDFNPKQVKIESSSIDKLPLRKCNTSKSISQVSEKSNNQERLVIQSQLYNIEMLKRINESLERQNAYLKKQLEFFTQACSSKRNSITTAIITSTKKKQDSTYKDKLASRIDMKSDKNDTQSTGIFNSKVSSGKKADPIQQSISQLYSRFRSKAMLPKSTTLRQVIINFFQSLKQNYAKLKILAEEVPLKQQKSGKQAIDALSAIQLIVLSIKNPNIARQSLFNERMKNAGKKEQSKAEKIEDFVSECGNNPSQLSSLFQCVVKYGLKSSKFLMNLRTSIYFNRLVKKITKFQ